MISKYRKLYGFLILSIICSGLISQTVKPSKASRLHTEIRISNSTLPLSIGLAAVLYLINPVIQYENKKVFAGITKEFSVGWGKLGEHRTALEYSLIFGGKLRNFIRFSYKYDLLLKKIEPSNILQGTGVITAGAGYFTDFKGTGGVFPELSYGYSIRNHKLLFYPHVKLRHTMMLKKDKPSITDFSFGIILGIANPFIEMKIRRKY